MFKTEGIKYAGSKLKMLPHILELARKGEGIVSVLDGFSGSTRVSQAFAVTGLTVTANDVSVWSECLGQCYLMSRKPDSFYREIIDHLNAIKGYDGWFTDNYGGGMQDCKRLFQHKNTRKLDAIRDEIECLGLDQIDKSVLLTSLIRALDAVDSTMGHYVSYLNNWSARSYKDLTLKLPRRMCNSINSKVIRGDIFDTIARDEHYDLAYFDPPYGSNNEKMPPSRVRYASYYHIWKTVIENDHPKLFGKASRREDSRDGVASSVFEDYRHSVDGGFVAMQALDRLVREVKARYVLLSYSSGGRATKEQLISIIEHNGRLIKAVEIDYRRNVMSSMSWTGEWLNSEGRYCEYLFLIEK